MLIEYHIAILIFWEFRFMFAFSQDFALFHFAILFPAVLGDTFSGQMSVTCRSSLENRNKNSNAMTVLETWKASTLSQNWAGNSYILQKFTLSFEDTAETNKMSTKPLFKCGTYLK